MVQPACPAESRLVNTAMAAMSPHVPSAARIAGGPTAAAAQVRAYKCHYVHQDSVTDSILVLLSLTGCWNLRHSLCLHPAAAHLRVQCCQVHILRLCKAGPTAPKHFGVILRLTVSVGATSAWGICPVLGRHAMLTLAHTGILTLMQPRLFSCSSTVFVCAWQPWLKYIS